MSEERYLLRIDEANKLLASADGNAALLYLHILTEGGRFSISAAARDLRRSEAEIARAAELLRKLGLMPKPEPLLDPSELPNVTAQDIVLRAQTDGAFRDLVSETEQSLGRVLSSHDLEVLFGIYDHLGLPADVIMLLLHHCIEEYQTRNGAGRMPTMRFIEKEGWFWAEQEILTLDAAEEHLRMHRQRQEAAGQVKEALQIRGREFTATERKYVDSWLAMGFGAEAIAIAYDRTLARTGRLAWNYMDSILRSWSEKQLFTAEAISAGDPMQRPKRSAAAAVPTERPQTEDLKNLKKLHDSLRGTGRKGN
jgi:DNA replication protein DnaD